MESQTDSGATRSNPRFIIGGVILVAIAGAIVLFALAGPITSAKGLLPVLATATALPDDAESLSPIPVTFTELNSNPINYLNMPIQVSGGYLQLESPACLRYSGPSFKWALVSEDLQLDAQGFERVIRILEPGTAMTVQGIWRLYQGPLGCGKGPPSGSTWYLQVQRIVQPNPLVGNGSGSPIDIEGADLSLPPLLATDVPTLTPTTTPTQIIETPAATATVNQIVPSLTIEATSTIDSGVIATPSLTPSFPTNTPDPGGNPSPTASVTATPVPGGGENDPTATPQTIPPTATETSGGEYPGPPTATPTATPDSYP